MTSNPTSNDPTFNPGPRRLNLLPSIAQIVSDIPICTAILQAVSSADAHVPPNRFSAALLVLWTPARNGPFDGQFLPWAALRASRNIKDRVMAIMDQFSQWDNDTTPYPTALQSLAKRLFDEHRDAQEELAHRRNTELRQEQTHQSANN